jgi:surfeit locus 1 family protein
VTGRRSLLLPAVVAAVAFAMLMALGVWQLERKTWKENLIATLAERMSAPSSSPTVHARYRGPSRPRASAGARAGFVSSI